MHRSAALLAAVLCASCGKPDATPAQPDASASTPAASPSARASASSAASAPASAAPSAEAPRAAPAKKGRVVTRSFRSEALGVEKVYLAWLPGDYDEAKDKRWPVIYLLHGYGGDETNWVRAGHLDVAADAMGLRAIVVMPDGDDSFYANWAAPLPYAECVDNRPSAFGRTERAETYCVRRPRYEDYMAGDLVQHVDATYRSIADRKARAITGVSMGGFGALMLAMRHTDVFAIAASHSGVVSPLYEAPHPYREGEVVLGGRAEIAKEFPDDLRAQARRALGAAVATWRAHDPSQLAFGLAEGRLALYVDCGTEDGFKLADHARYLHEVLGKAGVTHTFELVPGGHSFALWKDRIGKSLAFDAAEFARAGY